MPRDYSAFQFDVTQPGLIPDLTPEIIGDLYDFALKYGQPHPTDPQFLVFAHQGLPLAVFLQPPKGGKWYLKVLRADRETGKPRCPLMFVRDGLVAWDMAATVREAVLIVKTFDRMLELNGHIDPVTGERLPLPSN